MPITSAIPRVRPEPALRPVVTDNLGKARLLKMETAWTVRLVKQIEKR